MGKIIYDPRSNSDREHEQIYTEEKQPKNNTKTKNINVQNQTGMEYDFYDNPSERYEKLLSNIDSVRPIGDTDCEYIMYLEDYAYTYLYQYAKTDLTKEKAAILVGEYYPDTKENIISGIIPIDENLLSPGETWISVPAVQAILEKKEQYFPNTEILGWLHMQPGYGTMLTSAEIKAHREIFDQKETILLLVDPLNKIETFYVYNGNSLQEQTGFYLYYDKNPCMQQFMLDNPFIVSQKEEDPDEVVKQFREIGSRRKKEFQTRQKTNFSVVASCLALLAMGAILTKTPEDSNLLASPTQAVFNESEDFDQKTEEINGVKYIIKKEEDEPSVDIINKVEEQEIAPQNSESEPLIKENQQPVVIEEQQPKVIEEQQVEVEKEVAEEKATEAISEDVTESDDYIIYSVEQGDTLRGISKKHFNSEGRVLDILEWNDMAVEDGDKIFVGQKLKILNE
ncbi:hypothetical protein AN639_01380 [Candidatus Epulonipiscium fishelsonii]|uniref:Uncharacterized protein n=1 Tax=Candidatus Epulonipiscium fishelsonii TaxID=77094 RepID=A0ACC8XBS7_9FIRM|nr:hypothetical protein AN639_01380 [Epulopiscium sp. SCG-B05WGA-EpuloA1]ONI40019.1 hypothetical protein AN396_06625 [Epulopiscium sp. SCG-B11WGA-EpuloA1]